MKIVDFDLRMMNAIAIETEPGLYTLSEFVGGAWELVLRPRWFGQQFKRVVLRGQVGRVRWAGKKSNRSQLYEVVAESTLVR